MQNNQFTRIASASFLANEGVIFMATFSVSVSSKTPPLDVG